MVDTRIARRFYFKFPKAGIYCYVILLSLSYVIVQVHTPIQIEMGPHDGGLFMSLGRSLAEGRWFGRFNEFTLMKGPGYPGFLALGHWLGISISLAHALFHCAAIIFFVVVVHRLVGSLAVSGLLLALLLWHPVSMTSYLLRVYRDSIYYGQVLIVLAAVLWTLFCANGRREKALFAAVSGAFLGWFWLTREEGVWILPALIVFVLVAAFRAARERCVRELAATLLILFGVFAAIQGGFRALNWIAYGKFVGVDVKETNFQRALGALHSVRTGGTRPFVSITRAARERVYAVSPAFASLASHLDGAPGEAWASLTCNVSPITCGEIGSGWFMWELRHAAAGAGYYATPAKASAFFGQLADEVSAACLRGTLECSPQLISQMPPFSWRQVVDGLPQRISKFGALLLVSPPLQPGPSTGTRESLATNLRFLNYPAHSRSADIVIAPLAYVLSGWYYKSGREWLWVQVKRADGSLAEVDLSRQGSPDIQHFFKDPAATNQRFTIRTPCGDDCVMQFRAADNAATEKSLAELRRSPIGFDVGSGIVYVDTTEIQDNPGYAPQWSEVMSYFVRAAIVMHYNFIFLPVFIIGIVAFVASTLFYWRIVLSNMCYIIAFTSWLLVLVRTALLILIDATSFPALHVIYLAPAHFLLVCGAVLSCAAWLQLSLTNSSSSPIE